MSNKSEKEMKEILLEAYRIMFTAKSMTELYEEQMEIVKKYVHATSRGHEAIQIALGIQLKPQDFVSPYYRDDSIMMSIGMSPYEMMLQLMCKADDPFSGGRTYYCHASLKDDDKPKIIHQSSATGMQAIPTTGIAMGIQYKELHGMAHPEKGHAPVVVCSLGDACVSEGEVSEAFHMAATKQLPILYLVQDNEWDISAHASEIRTGDAFDYIKGFKGIEAFTIDGTDFLACYNTIKDTIEKIRTERRPFLIHAKVPLLNHHTSGVRMEWYRDDLEESWLRDPLPKLKALLKKHKISAGIIKNIETDCIEKVRQDFDKALQAPDPKPEDLYTNDFLPTPITEEKGVRYPEGVGVQPMVDCALHAINEILGEHPESLVYGQDVGERLGGVFRETALLAKKYGNHRVFNTPIQEAFIVGSTVGMSAVGLKPIVEVQFADYIWPGLNQLFTEVSRSCYLSNGKWPVSMVLRVPIGAYGKGGPYHSSSVESVLTNIHGIKVVYPSNGADLKGLMKAAYYDPNPVVMLEHKGLYWSKVPGTKMAKSIVPDKDYIVPLGVGNIVLEADLEKNKTTILVVAYGMGVHWGYNAGLELNGQVEVLDLRTLAPLDMKLIKERIKVHNRCLVITEEPVNNSFAQSIAARLQESCFEYLDAPVRTIGSKNMPAIPLNEILEREMILTQEEVKEAIESLLNY